MRPGLRSERKLVLKGLANRFAVALSAANHENDLTHAIIAQAFQVADRVDQYDVMATVKGGGLSGQAGAVRHGITKALTYSQGL